MREEVQGRAESAGDKGFYEVIATLCEGEGKEY